LLRALASIWPQAEHLRNLNAAGSSEAVAAAFESGRVAMTADTLGEYVKALARLDRLDNSRVMALMQVMIQISTAQIRLLILCP
jgi:hypothetical protein